MLVGLSTWILKSLEMMREVEEKRIGVGSFNERGGVTKRSVDDCSENWWGSMAEGHDLQRRWGL